MRKTINTVVIFLSLLIIATIPILFAAVQPWVWSIYLLLIIGLFILHMWARVNQSLLPRINPQQLTVTIFFVLTLILWIPLPYHAIAWLSPARAELLSQAWALTGDSRAWATLSYLPRAAFGWWVFLLSLGLFYCVTSHLCLDRKMLEALSSS